MHASNLKAVLGVGALAGAMFLTGIGATSLPGAFAQDAAPATPSAATGGESTSTMTHPRLQAMTERYETFLGKMAAELGTTDEAVDAAIRASLKGMIDDAVAAGDLAANDATAIKERIDAAEIPVLGIAGHDDGPGFGRHRGRGDGGDDGHRGGWDDDRDDANRPDDDADDDVDAETQSTGGSPIDVLAPVI